MTSQFITPCYVRVDDKDKRLEVCKRLEQIGYTLFKAINQIHTNTIVTDVQFADKSYMNPPDYFVWSGDFVVRVLRENHYNCGTNIDLFLDLAGMRSDTDKGQLFFDLLGHKWRCKYDELPEKFRLGNFHKATATEIINHHKQQG